MKLFDLRIKTKSTITIAGPSQSGKTTLVEKLVTMRDVLFDDSFSCVIWFCAYIPKERIDGVKYVQGLPNKSFQEIPPNALVILDDYMSELSQSNDFTNMLTKSVHHLPMTLIYITQNLFQRGKDDKTRRMNTNYIILFKNPHDRSQIEYLGRQMFPNDKKFLLNVYSDVTSDEPFSYILLDCHQDTPDVIRVRTRITEKNIRVFVPNSVAIYV